MQGKEPGSYTGLRAPMSLQAVEGGCTLDPFGFVRSHVRRRQTCGTWRPRLHSAALPALRGGVGLVVETEAPTSSLVGADALGCVEKLEPCCFRTRSPITYLRHRGRT